MEQWTGSKLGKEYIKTVFCHPACLTYRQSTSRKLPGWMKLKLETRLLGEVQTPQFKIINALSLSFLYSPNSHPHLTIGKNNSFD